MNLATLTKEQRNAVELGDGVHLITAPPGSGKTEVLVQRVIHLLEKSPGDLFRILALTYTVKAAGELNERVRQIVPERDRWRVNATTFHSFAMGLLQNYGEPVGLKSPITVISDVKDKQLLVTPLLEDRMKRIDLIDYNQWKSLFDEIALRKTDLKPPNQVDGDRMLGGRISLHEAYDAYELALANAGYIDYEGMIYQAVRLLRIDPWVGSHLRRQYRHTLVDEGQELTRGQYELLKEMRGDTQPNVFIVADVDQSINAFAGGGPKFLQKFAEDFTADRLELTTNFRSARAIEDILQSLRRYIQNDNWKKEGISLQDKAVLAKGWVGARSYDDEKIEAQAVSSWIISLIDDGLDQDWVYEGETTDVTPEDICLLGRTRYTFNAVIEELESREIPVVLKTDQGDLFESRLGRLGYCFLKLTDNPRDLPSKRRLLDELDNRSIGIEHLDDITKIRRILRECTNRNNLSKDFFDTFISSDITLTNSLESVRQLIRLDLEFDSEEEGIAWHQDQHFFNWFLSEYELKTSALSRSLSGFLRMLSHLEQTPSSEPGVRVLTPHRARGLGFKVVVVVGMREGNFPHYRAATQDELEEERRVVYVAASRAARALLFTRPRKRITRYSNSYLCHESRFLKEMGLIMEDLPK